MQQKGKNKDAVSLGKRTQSKIALNATLGCNLCAFQGITNKCFCKYFVLNVINIKRKLQEITFIFLYSCIF